MSTFDLWVRGVAIDTKVFKLKIINVLDLVTSDVISRVHGEGAWLLSKLRDEYFVITSLILKDWYYILYNYI